ncbi:MAG: hypothetical protein ABJ388_02025 [Alphaproteobacteria bacterium]
MRQFIVLLAVGYFLCAIASAAEPDRPQTLPYVPVDRDAYTRSLRPLEQVRYFHGLVDYFLFVTKNGSNGEKMKRCIEQEAPWLGHAISISLFELYLKKAEPDTSMPAVLQAMMRDACVEYLK